jgi:hypothetical protein
MGFLGFFNSMAGQMVSKISLAALAARSHWLTIEWLPNTLQNSTTSKSSGAA